MSGQRLLRFSEVAAVAVAWVVLVVCLSVTLCSAPGLTRLLVSTLDVADQAGMTEERVEGLAERVRLYVTSSDAEPLPEQVAGRPAFDETARAHLLDVRRVLLGVRRAVGVSALMLAAWIGWSLARKRWEPLARGIRAGGWTTLALVSLLALFVAFGFDSAFVAMHEALFPAGTWLFPEGSLLITLFPRAFWVVMAALCVGVALVGGLSLAVTGVWMSHSLPSGVSSRVGVR
ncbi:MAG: hypothetical protein Kow0056_09760 [Coriobacteriia bacterium]